MARKANTTEAPAQEQPRAPTFDLNDPTFQAILAQAVAVAMAAKAAEKPEKKSDAAKIKAAFAKAGFKDVVLFDAKRTLAEQPDVTVLTFNKWMELGRKVKPGEHAIRVRGYHLRLFHKTQTEIATTAERKAHHKQQQERATKRDAKAQPQPAA